VLGYLDPCGSKVIKFDVTYVKPHLPNHVAFQIHIDYSKYTIKRTIIDEGTATCMMYLVCWKSLGHPTLSQSPTMLTAFDGHYFHPHGILPTFPIQLGGKTVDMDVKVVDVPLEYNFLLGRNCTYSMISIVLFVFHILFFPNDGKIMKIDKLSFAYAIPNASVGLLIPVIDNYQLTIENINVIMYSSLMGTFNSMAPIYHIYAMSSRSASSMRSVPFFTSYFNDPWTLPSSTPSCKGQSHTGMDMPLLAIEIAYQVVLDSSVDLNPITSQTNEEDLVLKLVWATSSSCSHD
jgi:hypothetical protein